MFEDPNIFKPLRNSLLMAVIATLANLVFGVIASYVLVKRKFVGKSFVDILVMIPWAFACNGHRDELNIRIQ
ncbi:hypothetical protein RCO48_04160 [Peribacillus frigoritolerans]|nr:hypothetical protein [Peribacillus frigoritolerans]